MTRLPSAVAVVAALASGGAATAQSIDYESCVARIEIAPERARELAAQWEALGGGALARHCGALALIVLGADIQAATILTEIASEPEFESQQRVAILILAGELWIGRGEVELARRTFSAALRLNETSREARIGLARVAAEDQDWDAAIALLTSAVDAAPASEPDFEALILRAAARRAAGDPDGALDDATAATDAAPEAALAWFERGAAEAALGLPTDARESWLLASMMDPVGVVGDMARDGLQRLILGE